MSGGSYDYAYRHIEDIQLHPSTNELAQSRRDVLQQLLKLVAITMHTIEWIDSGDRGPGDEVASIDACLAFAAEKYTQLCAIDLVRVSPFYEEARKAMHQQGEWYTRKIFEDVHKRLAAKLAEQQERLKEPWLISAKDAVDNASKG